MIFYLSDQLQFAKLYGSFLFYWLPLLAITAQIATQNLATKSSPK